MWPGVRLSLRNMLNLQFFFEYIELWQSIRQLLIYLSISFL